MYLQKFDVHELKFNEEETKEILLFIFSGTEKSLIDNIVIDNRVRGFAQALLIEAVDASFKIGFIQSLWESTVNPTLPIKKVIQKVAKGFATHYFKHATKSDLRQIKIYEFVINALRIKHKTRLHQFINGIAMNSSTPLIRPNYILPNNKKLKVIA